MANTDGHSNGATSPGSAGAFAFAASLPWTGSTAGDAVPLVTDQFRDSFVPERDALLAVARQRLDVDAPAVRAVGKWLNREHSAAAVRADIEQRKRLARHKAVGTPEHAEPMRGRPPSRTEADVESKLSRDALWALRLERALSQLLGQVAKRAGGQSWVLSEEEAQTAALRAVVVSGCVLDPKADEWLAAVTPLAKCRWGTPGGAPKRVTMPRSARSRTDLCRLHGPAALMLLRRACETLGWRAGTAEPSGEAFEGAQQQGNEQGMTEHVAAGDAGAGAQPTDPIAKTSEALGQVQNMGELFASYWKAADDVRATCGAPKPIDFPAGFERRQRRAEAVLQADREAMVERGEDAGAVWVSVDEGPWPDTMADLSYAFRLFHGAIDGAIAVLPAVAPFMDAGEPRPPERWTARVRAELVELKATANPAALGMDGLGIVRTGNPLPVRLVELVSAIAGRRNELVAVAGAPAGDAIQTGAAAGALVSPRDTAENGQALTTRIEAIRRLREIAGALRAIAETPCPSDTPNCVSAGALLAEAIRLGALAAYPTLVNVIRISEARWTGPTISPSTPRRWPGQKDDRLHYGPPRTIDGREYWWWLGAEAFRKEAGLSLSGWTPISDMPEDLRLIADAIEADAERCDAGGGGDNSDQYGIGSGFTPGGATTPVLKPDGWTRSELIAQAKEDVAFSATTFDAIRKAAEIPAAESGGKGQQRRFSQAQLRRLIDAAESGSFRHGKRVAESWRDLLTAQT